MPTRGGGGEHTPTPSGKVRQLLGIIVVVYDRTEDGKRVPLERTVREVNTRQTVKHTPRPKMGERVLPPETRETGRHDVYLVPPVKCREKQRHDVRVRTHRHRVLDLPVGVPDHAAPEKSVVKSNVQMATQHLPHVRLRRPRQTRDPRRHQKPGSSSIPSGK